MWLLVGVFYVFTVFVYKFIYFMACVSKTVVHAILSTSKKKKSILTSCKIRKEIREKLEFAK